MTLEYHRASIRHLVYTNVLYMYFAYVRWRSGKNKHVGGYIQRYVYIYKVYIHRFKKKKCKSVVVLV